MLEAPLLFKNWWPSAWVDLIFLGMIGIPAALSLSLRGRLGPEIRSFLSSRIQRASALAICFWSALLIVSWFRGIDHGLYGTPGAVLATGTLGIASFVVLAGLVTLGPKSFLRWAGVGLGILVMLNLTLHLSGVTNPNLNLARELPPNLLYKGDARFLGLFGLDIPLHIFPLGDGHSALGLPIALATILNVALAASHRGRWRQFFLVSTGVCGAILLLADRQGPIVAAILTLLIAPFVRRKPRRLVWLFLACIGTAVLGAASWPLIQTGLGEEAYGSTRWELLTLSNRTPIWFHFLTETVLDPHTFFFGRGWYGHMVYQEHLIAVFGRPHDPHNFYIASLINGGAPLLLAWSAAIAIAIKISSRMREADVRYLSMTILCFLLIVGIPENCLGLNQRIANPIFLGAILAMMSAFRSEEIVGGMDDG